MIDKEEISDKILSTLNGLYNTNVIELHHRFEDDLNFDVLDIVSCVMNFENEFNIYLNDDEVESLKKVEDLVNIIHSKIS